MPDDRLVKMVLLGSVDGVRQRGRPPKRWTDNITEWTEMTLRELYDIEAGGRPPT